MQLSVRTFLWPILVLGLLAGCDRVTVENYDRLEPGMSYDEVTAILGKPTECDALLKMKSCSWGDEDRRISIQFLGDEVMVLSSRGLR